MNLTTSNINYIVTIDGKVTTLSYLGKMRNGNYEYEAPDKSKHTFTVPLSLHPLRKEIMSNQHIYIINSKP